MGKVKDLLIEVENIFRQKEEEGLKFEEVDDDTHRQMLGRYIEEKGLKNSSEFDLDDWLKWSERKVVCDMRTPEQKNKEMNMIVSLQEILEMTDEEAEQLGVRHIKNMYYKHKFEEIKKEEFINGETYDDMINHYLKEKGLTLQSEIDAKDFEEWLDKKSHEYFNQKFGAKPKDVDDLYNLIDRYCKENDCHPKKIDYNHLNKWCKKSKIPIPLKMKQFFKQRAKTQTQ